MSTGFQTVEKGFTEFAVKSGKAIPTVFSRGVYVEENTSQNAKNRRKAPEEIFGGLSLR